MTDRRPAPVRPFRFGVGPGAVVVESGPHWRDFARRVEDLGYSTLSVGDHLTGAYGPVAALAVAAEATSRLRVGALTFCNDYRHPVVLAQEAATLDLLSDGRLELGIGAGWMHADYERAGIPFASASERVDRLRDALVVLRGYFAGRPFDHAGAHYRIEGLAGRPAPVQRPGPPILVGGSGAKVLTLAAREADVVGLNVNLGAGHLGPQMGASATHAATVEKVELVRRESAARARHPELQVYVHVAAVGDRAGGLDRAAASFGTTAEAAADSPHVLAGDVEEVVDVLERRRAAYGISYVSVAADAVAGMAPVVARLAGK